MKVDTNVKVFSNTDNESLAFAVKDFIDEYSKPGDRIDVKYSTVFDQSENKILYSALVYIEHK